ncbi:Inositol 3-kinase [Heracleum sosnowskyi]|uniref:Inositol 3-kinase n=1 Tax=Heracleum sosnowskyi TaxID=360622 RepID=A0AAD8J206_9APIA|nr:Inositol 3-kinase [Heracleum sosnowskyi]
MVKKIQSLALNSSPRGLIAGNYCHDVLIKDDVVIAESLGGAASFISALLDGLSIPVDYVCKVGPDFRYQVNHKPLVSYSCETTVFHAYFCEESTRNDRVLKRVGSCDPIFASDLPDVRFDFGMAVGVGGEIVPETLEKMVNICNVVFVDIQALIRVFDPVDGTVSLVNLKDTGFYRLLPRIGFLKASAEEALFMDLEEVRKWCCVVVTNGKEGCTVYWKDAELKVSPFPTVQVDPTGAGDSFLGGLVAGLVQGLVVQDAALLGNLFGSLTVSHIGLPKLDFRLFEEVRSEVQRRKMQCMNRSQRHDEEDQFTKPVGHEQFLLSLRAVKSMYTCPVQASEGETPSSTKVDLGNSLHCTGQQKLLLNTMYKEPIKTVETNP